MNNLKNWTFINRDGETITLECKTCGLLRSLPRKSLSLTDGLTCTECGS